MTRQPAAPISASLEGRSDGRMGVAAGSLDFAVCQARTKSGKPCTLPGEADSGLCRHQHDPRWAEERAARNALAGGGIATRASATPDVVVAKWADSLDWSTPELLAESLQEAAGFVAARALSTKQGDTFAKLAETAAEVRGWPLAKSAPGPVVVEVQRFGQVNGTEPSS